MYGKYPQDGTDQMLIPDFVAEYLKDSNDYKNISDVVGSDITLNGKDDKDQSATLTYQVSGIYDSQTNKVINTDYELYTSYHKVNLQQRAKDFTSDFYQSDKSFYEQQGQTYLDYYKPTYSTIEDYSQASGYFYDQMYIITEEGKTRDVISELEKLYPNNIIESQYTYKHDKDLGGDTFNMIRRMRIIFITVTTLIFSLIIYVIQKGYYLSKRKDYAELYSLGLRKKQIFKIMILEAGIDIVIVIVSVMLITLILHFIPIRMLTNMFYYVFTLKTILTTMLFLISLHLLIVLFNLKQLKYNKINKVLS